MDNTKLIFSILIISAMTILIRSLPFLVFRKGTPESVLYLGRVLPFSVMGMLVVYCLKEVRLFSGSYGVPELIAILLIFILHKWKHNTLLSVLSGTVFYMVLVQTGVFGVFK